MSDESNKGGRPTIYQEAYNEQARKLCLLGYTDKELAEFFGVCERTVNNWKEEQEGFLQSIMDGKDNADAEVAEGLFKNATGWTRKYTETYKDGQVKDRETYYPPETQAASLWLRNRQKTKWRDSKGLDLGGPDGEPIDAININIKTEQKNTT